MDQRIVCVDLGGTHIRAALCTSRGEMLLVHKRDTLADGGPIAVIAQLVEAIRTVTLGTPPLSVHAVVVGAPGPLDPRSGVVIDAPNLPGFVNIPLRERLQCALGLPTWVENDANLAALGEHRFGAGQGIRDLAYITVSTGIGGGLIVNDRLLHGFHGFAGEFGHMISDPNGPRCNCGNYGCLEAVASGPSIARKAREALAAGAVSILPALCPNGNLSYLEAPIVAQAAAQGDDLAIRLFRGAGIAIGLALVSLINLLDPQRIVVGGGVARAGNLLLDPIRQTVWSRTRPAFLRGLDIVPAALGDDAGLLGGVALVLEEHPL